MGLQRGFGRIQFLFRNQSQYRPIQHYSVAVWFLGCCFNIKNLFGYGKKCKYKTVIWLYYLNQNGNSYTGKMASLYWNGFLSPAHITCGYPGDWALYVCELWSCHLEFVPLTKQGGGSLHLARSTNGVFVGSHCHGWNRVVTGLEKCLNFSGVLKKCLIFNFALKMVIFPGKVLENESFILEK